MKIKLDAGAYMPERAHEQDAGLDLRTPKALIINSYNSVVVDTGVHVQLPPGTVGMLKSKSGLNVKMNLTSEGVIDEGYTGSIVVKLYNHGAGTVELPAGSKISQLVILPVIRTELELVNDLEETERGDNGFGSTGM